MDGVDLSIEVMSHVNMRMLVLLSDKHQVEGVITPNRHIFMEGFVTAPMLPRPDKMLPKLCTIPRFRLEVFCLQRAIETIEKLIHQRGFPMANEGENLE